MKVLELLDELEGLIEDAQSIPLSGKKIVDKEVVFEILEEIKRELPQDIDQAQWIKNESNRILEEAKSRHEQIISDARAQAETMIESDDITLKARQRAEEIMSITEENCKELKMNTYNYIDSILFNFQNKMEEINAVYFQEMYDKVETIFANLNNTLTENRAEIKDLATYTKNQE